MPPEIERKIGIELGKHDVRQQAAPFALESKTKAARNRPVCSRVTNVAMRADPGFDPLSSASERPR